MARRGETLRTYFALVLACNLALGEVNMHRFLVLCFLLLRLLLLLLVLKLL